MDAFPCVAFLAQFRFELDAPSLKAESGLVVASVELGTERGTVLVHPLERI